jgi:hypothetical protein
MWTSMKPEKKPFVVEVKNRRSLSRKGRTIWGNVDLKAAAADHVSVEQAADGAARTDAASPGSKAKQEPIDTVA